jgi:hypothetical protein
MNAFLKPATSVLCMVSCLMTIGGLSARQLPAGKVPPAVKRSCESKFPGKRAVEWKFKADRNYEAEFAFKGSDMAVKFDSTGKWLETETTIKKTGLTKQVLKAISREFNGYRIIETQTVTRTDDTRIIFEVHLENAREVLKVQLEDNGTVLTKSAKPKKAAR